MLGFNEGQTLKFKKIRFRKSYKKQYYVKFNDEDNEIEFNSISMVEESNKNIELTNNIDDILSCTINRSLINERMLIRNIDKTDKNLVFCKAHDLKSKISLDCKFYTQLDFKTNGIDTIRFVTFDIDNGYILESNDFTEYILEKDKKPTNDLNQFRNLSLEKMAMNVQQFDNLKTFINSSENKGILTGRKQ